MSDTKSRNIVILLDGTANQFSDRNTNLIKLVSVIRSDEDQLIYYSSGIGTVLPDNYGARLAVKRKAAQLADMGLAWTFEDFVCKAYKFLMDYYRDGDKVYLFGFSRGAYTARALAGMIQRVGLLPAGMNSQIHLAYDMYTEPLDKKADGTDRCVLYRQVFGRSRPVFIKFMGVWDTVSSLGTLIDLPSLPFAAGATSVRFFRQALALDERRARFTPEYWRYDDDTNERGLLADIEDAWAKLNADPNNSELQVALQAAKDKLGSEHESTATVGKTAGDRKIKRRIECWFMGSHSDVGGGNTLNGERSLSNIPFRWMLREAAICGLLLDHRGVAVHSALQIPYAMSTSSVMEDQLRQLAPETTRSLAKLREIAKREEKDRRVEFENTKDVEDLRKKVPQSELVKLVEALAAADSDLDAPRLSEDVSAEITESLVGAYHAMEMLVVKKRKYSDSGAAGEDELIINFGQRRQIWPGQMCHRSVLRRLIHDHELHRNNRKLTKAEEKNEYERPAAMPPRGWPQWKDIKRGMANTRGFWEV